MTTEQPSKYATIVREIRDALCSKGPMTNPQLVKCCETAEDGRVMSRVIYDLRQSGMIRINPKLGPPGRDGRPAKRYEWIGSLDALPPPAPHRKKATKPPEVTAQAPEVTASEVTSSDLKPGEVYLSSYNPIFNQAEESVSNQPTQDAKATSTDPTEYAIADLVDQADEALLAYADSLLADDPVWDRLRRLADEAHSTLCNYRLMRTLEAK